LAISAVAVTPADEEPHYEQPADLRYAASHEWARLKLMAALPSQA
jgi:hypothetical protein